MVTIDKGSTEHRIAGAVAKLITDTELAINKGRRDGVRRGMVFDILDPVPFLRKRPEAFGKHVPTLHFNCLLATFGQKNGSFCFNEVSNIYRVLK